jgi:hypothetical protein
MIYLFLAVWIIPFQSCLSCALVALEVEHVFVECWIVRFDCMLMGVSLEVHHTGVCQFMAKYEIKCKVTTVYLEETCGNMIFGSSSCSDVGC